MTTLAAIISPLRNSPFYQDEEEMDETSPDYAQNMRQKLHEKHLEEEKHLEDFLKTRGHHTHKCEHCLGKSTTPTYECVKKILGSKDAALLYQTAHATIYGSSSAFYLSLETNMKLSEPVRILCQEKYPWILNLEFNLLYAKKH